MLAHGHSLLDEAVQVLGEGGREALALQDAEDLGVGHGVDLRHAVVVTEQNADLGRGHALLRELGDDIAHLRAGDLQPGRGGALVGQSGTAHALAGSVHATHGGCSCDGPDGACVGAFERGHCRRPGAAFTHHRQTFRRAANPKK